MKRFLLPAILVASFCASVSLMDAQQNYETNLKFIREGFTNTMVGLGETTIDKAQYQNALRVLEDAQQIVNFEAKDPKIVAKNIKAKLDDAIAKMRDILESLRNVSSTDERLDIATKGIGVLKTKLPGLKTGLTDIFKTPTDLKNGMYAVVAALIATLEKFQRDAQQSGGVEPVNKASADLVGEVLKLGEELKEKLYDLSTGVQFKMAPISPVYPVIESLRKAITNWCADRRVSSESLKELMGAIDLIKNSLEKIEQVQNKSETEKKSVLVKLIRDFNKYRVSFAEYARKDKSKDFVFPARSVDGAQIALFGALKAWYQEIEPTMVPME
ncbi:TPA: hypothetical protein DDZ86_00930 [Candidatus Dependentiae bacterium]|nr:MAG: hypothetical protein UW09_C0004G0068 [candidate division TM6 bacterium GW2011_GWF2_43_87]HBL98189.1 hypothetical protein [Candidatus Dependentiae bacterium]